MKKTIAALVAMLLLCAAALAEGGLPAYRYTGADPLEGAVAMYTASLGEPYLHEDGDVTIPAPIIVRYIRDAESATVYGDFWVLNYVQKDNVLFCISGGENPGVLTLKNQDGKWTVTDAEFAGDGEDYSADIKRFCAGDEEMEKVFFEGADLDSEAAKSIRTAYIRDYVKANGLAIDAYQDFGWDPVPLAE